MFPWLANDEPTLYASPCPPSGITHDCRASRLTDAKISPTCMIEQITCVNYSGVYTCIAHLRLSGKQIC